MKKQTMLLIIAIVMIAFTACTKSYSSGNNNGNNTSPTTNIVTITDNGKDYTTTIPGCAIVNHLGTSTASFTIQGTGSCVHVSVGVWSATSDIGYFYSKSGSALNNNLTIYPDCGTTNINQQYNVDSSSVNITTYVKGTTVGTDQVAGTITLYVSYYPSGHKTLTGTFNTNKGSTSNQ